jgi:ElaB/YqjD/DUF883 family membrane-anchored ribosome-binding protein
MAQTSTQTDPGSSAGQAREQAEHVKQQARQAGGQAKDKLREQVDQRSTQAGERVGSTAHDVGSVAEELRKQGKDQPARLAEQAADRLERVGGYLQESDADRILRDVEDFGRRKPWAVAFGGLALGFVAGRFLRASSRQRYEQLQSDPSYTPRRGLSAGIPTAETTPPRPATPPASGSPADTSA